ncbi:mCG1028477 [Mus musculus]|nr:mCG1028477 [Mus musculus]
MEVLLGHKTKGSSSSSRVRQGLVLTCSRSLWLCRNLAATELLWVNHRILLDQKYAVSLVWPEHPQRSWLEYRLSVKGDSSRWTQVKTKADS